jgi:phosphoribosylformylglycinamidine synthase PurS subunit
MYLAKVVVTLRKSILDPQGKAVHHALGSLGINGVEQVRIGKQIEMTIDSADRGDAERITREACQKLLANPVMEDFSFTLEEM